MTTTAIHEFLDDAGRQGDGRLRTRLMTAVRLCCCSLPHLSGLAHRVEWLLDQRVLTAGVTASGRVLFNPAFLRRLQLREAAFVVAHELYHLILQSHRRQGEADFNIVNYAHDLIINDILEHSLRMPPPAGLLQCRGAREISLERLIVLLRKEKRFRSAHVAWIRTGRARRDDSDESTEQLGPIGRALADALKRPDSRDRSSAARGPQTDQPRLAGDVITREQELLLFPLDNSTDLDDRCRWVLELVLQSVALSSLSYSWSEDCPETRTPADRMALEIRLLRDHYDTPWERMIQSWLDTELPQPRSYARPSRRTGDRSDVVLPGRQRDSIILNVVLDTSGSMWPYLPAMLGAITKCCEAAGVQQVRLIQCDMAVSRDEVIPIEGVSDYVIEGFSGREGHPVRKAQKPPEPPAPPATTPPGPDPKPAPEPEAGRRRRRKVFSRHIQHSKPAARPKRIRRRMRRSRYFSIAGYGSREPNPTVNLDIESELPKPQRFNSWRTPDSDLCPALRLLAEDPQVEAVLVLTDGEVAVPEESPPYSLLWVLAHPQNSKPLSEFQPAFGEILHFPVPSR